jgi:3-deoxy-manno-octulosonate cytidylyltransferase (CMP-KDO synthetase)
MMRESFLLRRKSHDLVVGSRFHPSSFILRPSLRVTDFIAIIPARLGSTRLPNKPLLEIAGKPMVVHVAEKARASGAQAVWVATDNMEVAKCAWRCGFDAMLTSATCASGTERVAEVVSQQKFADSAIIVNVQGDEPLIDPTLIREAAEHLGSDEDAQMATVCQPIRSREEMFNPNVVKVVLDAQGHAIYFSRAPIPFARDSFAGETVPPGLPAYRHIGIYAYRAGFLRRYCDLTPSPIEEFEALEQLRVLWHGFKISIKVTERLSLPGVDTPEDLERVRQYLAVA